MIHAIGLVCLAVAFLPGAALKEHVAFDWDLDVDRHVAYTQELGNVEDVQYWGDISVGSQLIKGIMDTGSFELVAFSGSCPTCGMAGKYVPTSSIHYKKGNLSQIHSYGSGSCSAEDAFDTVSVGPFASGEQALWIATDCSMPLLWQAGFNSIVGIGPPGQPEFTAEEELRELEIEEEHYKTYHQPVPGSLEDEKAKARLELETARKKPSMLESFGVRTFSTCLGRAPGSKGWLIWNDTIRAEQPGVHRIHVLGNITWSTDLSDFSLGGTALGCTHGCAALLDTGTSLFAVHTRLYDAVLDHLNALNHDCSDLSKFPDLTMTLNGQLMRFPPSSYIGTFVGEPDSSAARFIRHNRSLHRDMQLSKDTRCELLLMDLGPPEDTRLGPLVILGMPFYREYYTTFDLGSGRGGRSIYVSEADHSCRPRTGMEVVAAAERNAGSYARRVVDASKLRVPTSWGHLKGVL